MSLTAAMFCEVRTDFGRPLPDWRVTADPILVMRRQIVFRVFKNSIASICRIPWSDGLSTKSSFVQSLNMHLVFVRISYPSLILFKLLRIPAAKYLCLLLSYDIIHLFYCLWHHQWRHIYPISKSASNFINFHLSWKFCLHLRCCNRDIVCTFLLVELQNRTFKFRQL